MKMIRQFEEWIPTKSSNNIDELLEILGYTREDIQNDEKFKQIKRDLKLKLLLNE